MGLSELTRVNRELEVGHRISSAAVGNPMWLGRIRMLRQGKRYLPACAS